VAKRQKAAEMAEPRPFQPEMPQRCSKNEHQEWVRENMAGFFNGLLARIFHGLGVIAAKSPGNTLKRLPDPVWIWGFYSQVIDKM
jgi:hypothetical protein